MRIRMYETYIADLLDHPGVRRLHDIKRHHWLRSRFEHSYAVGKLAFRMARAVHANVHVSARAGLLHDWYYRQRHPQHPKVKPDPVHYHTAARAAAGYGEPAPVLHAIQTHMWPYGRMIPRTREAWIVWSADNLVYLSDVWQSVKRYFRGYQPGGEVQP